MDGGPIEILLAEDSDVDAELTCRALRKCNLGSTVVRVCDGVDALDFIYCRGAHRERRGGHPKVVLLDIKMPRLNGIDVLRWLKGDDSTRTIPIVMLTSSQEGRDLQESYRLGVNSYLVKPVDLEAFTEVVSHAGRYWTAMNQLPL